MIKGIDKSDLLNYPPYTVATLYLGGCNFRCPYCHNPELVLGNPPDIPEEEIFSFLKKRKGWLEGVCITGGEPTLHKELPDLIKKIKSMGFLVKLDTNGTNPGMLAQLMEEKIIDFIAMDIKAPLDKYEQVTRVKTDIEKIKKSIELVKKIDHVFRTTAVPGLVSLEDLKKIAELVGSNYVVQDFRNTRPMIDPSFNDRKNFSMKELEEIRNYIKAH